jgi:hypothetical protein
MEGLPLGSPAGVRPTNSIGHGPRSGTLTYINVCLWTPPLGRGNAPKKGQKKGAGNLPHKAHSFNRENQLGRPFTGPGRLNALVQYVFSGLLRKRSAKSTFFFKIKSLTDSLP